MRRIRLPRPLPSSVLLIVLALGAGSLRGLAQGDGQTVPETAAPAESALVEAVPVLVDRIVAIVDEEAILQSDLERETELYRLERQYAGETVEGEPATVRREMLDRLIESKLIIAAAKQADMSVDQEAIDGSVDQKIQQFVEHFGSLEALERELTRSGMTLVDYRARMAAQLRDQQYLRLVVGKFIRPDIEVLENEVRDYYLAHLDEMPAEPDSLTIADILIAVQPSREVRQRVQDKVARIQSALSGGMSFAEAARTYSEDAAAPRGGVFGVVGRDDLFDAGLTRAVFALASGQVSEPVVTTRGVHLVRVDAVQEDGRRAISQIFLPVTVSEQDIAAARAQAEAARTRVLGGEAFALVASEVSADAASARSGGVLGTFRLEDLSETFQTALAELSEGAISEPVLTPAGWYVFKVLARMDGHMYTYEELAEQLRQAVESQKIEAALAEYVKDLRKRFFIDEKG
jgi:peptidyl-prolyl cis-trans isomerase SurA